MFTHDSNSVKVRIRANPTTDLEFFTGLFYHALRIEMHQIMSMMMEMTLIAIN